MVDSIIEMNNADESLTRHQRYHALNREKRIAYQMERYNNRPDVIARRAERDALQQKTKEERTALKDAEKELKRIEKERKQQERTALALATKKGSKKSATPKKTQGEDCPAER